MAGVAASKRNTPPAGVATGRKSMLKWLVGTPANQYQNQSM